MTVRSLDDRNVNGVMLTFPAVQQVRKGDLGESVGPDILISTDKSPPSGSYNLNSNKFPSTILPVSLLFPVLTPQSSEPNLYECALPSRAGLQIRAQLIGTGSISLALGFPLLSPGTEVFKQTHNYEYVIHT